MGGVVDSLKVFLFFASSQGDVDVTLFAYS